MPENDDLPITRAELSELTKNQRLIKFFEALSLRLTQPPPKDGTPGAPGTDGVGRETIYAGSTKRELGDTDKPSNGWGYQSPGDAASGLTWYSIEPDLNNGDYLWVSSRTIVGTPDVGEAVEAEWSDPSRITQVPHQGPQGLYLVRVYLDTLASASVAPERPTASQGMTVRYDPDTNTITGLSNPAWVTDFTEYNTDLVARWESFATYNPANSTLGEFSIPFRVEGSIGPAGQPGANGRDGIDGQNGIDGAAGADGYGPEFIYATIPTMTMSPNVYPLNSWGFDDPVWVVYGAAKNRQVSYVNEPPPIGTLVQNPPDGLGAIRISESLRWHDAAPDVPPGHYLFFSSRYVPGRPQKGTPVQDVWSVPARVSRVGQDGAPGLRGRAGQDGVGTEYVFAVTAGTNIPQNQFPNNNWGYDRPGTVNGLQWHDSAPDIPEGGYLYSAQRQVPGGTNPGDRVTDLWSRPARVSVSGPAGLAGVPGADGTDGQGVEFIFAVSTKTELSAQDLPSNSWGFDRPGQAASGLQWHDEAQELAIGQSQFWSKRVVEGSEAVVGAQVAGLWDPPKVLVYQPRIVIVPGSVRGDWESGQDYTVGDIVYIPATVTGTLIGSRVHGFYALRCVQDHRSSEVNKPTQSNTRPMFWRTIGFGESRDLAATSNTLSYSGIDTRTIDINIRRAITELTNSYEFIWATSSKTELAAADLPSNDWTYTNPGVAGDLTWSSGYPENARQGMEFLQVYSRRYQSRRCSTK